MYRAANTYLQGKTDSGISKVYFVIWKDDTATLKVAACYACSRNNQTIKETHIYFIFDVIILILLAGCFFKAIPMICLRRLKMKREVAYKIVHSRGSPYVPANISREMLITYMNKVIRKHS